MKRIQMREWNPNMKRCELCKKPHRPDSFWCSQECKDKHDKSWQEKQERRKILDEYIKKEFGF